MNTKRPMLIVVLGIALVAVLIFWQNRRHSEPPAPTEQPTEAGTQAASGPVPKRLATTLAIAPIGLAAKLDSIAAGLHSAPDMATKQQQLTELRQALASSPAKEAAAAIGRFLDSKSDAVTGLGFKPGANGRLAEAPTLRTFLLDELGRLDPEAAAAYARVILGSMDSPDEWAVALRNLALGDASPGGRALLEQKVGDMLRYDMWHQNPSAGYLEAFDAAVYLGGTHLVPTLAELVRKQDNQAVAHAAFLAMDRLVINDAATMLGTLQAAPDLMQGRELTRANYFARADVRDPQQRQVLESYLLDPRIGAAEMEKFAGLYPNANFMISQNLLTPTPTPDRATLSGRDAASLQTVREWLADPRFAQLRPQLEKMKSRLEEFARQGAGQ